MNTPIEITLNDASIREILVEFFKKKFGVADVNANDITFKAKSQSAAFRDAIEIQSANIIATLALKEINYI